MVSNKVVLITARSLWGLDSPQGRNVQWASLSDFCLAAIGFFVTRRALAVFADPYRTGLDDGSPSHQLHGFDEHKPHQRDTTPPPA